jgi:hypothetical protein
MLPLCSVAQDAARALGRPAKEASGPAGGGHGSSADASAAADGAAADAAVHAVADEFERQVAALATAAASMKESGVGENAAADLLRWHLEQGNRRAAAAAAAAASTAASSSFESGSGGARGERSSLSESSSRSSPSSPSSVGSAASSTHAWDPLGLAESGSDASSTSCSSGWSSDSSTSTNSADEQAQWEEFKNMDVGEHAEMQRIRRMVARLCTRQPLMDYWGKETYTVREDFAARVVQRPFLRKIQGRSHGSFFDPEGAAGLNAAQGLQFARPMLVTAHAVKGSYPPVKYWVKLGGGGRHLNAPPRLREFRDVVKTGALLMARLPSAASSPNGTSAAGGSADFKAVRFEVTPTAEPTATTI